MNLVIIVKPVRHAGYLMVHVRGDSQGPSIQPGSYQLNYAAGVILPPGIGMTVGVSSAYGKTTGRNYSGRKLLIVQVLTPYKVQRNLFRLLHESYH